MKEPTVYKLAPGCTIAVSFLDPLVTIDPREIHTVTNGNKSYTTGDQWLTICIIRPLEGARLTYTGVAVRNPDDQNNHELGERIAFERALSAMFPDLPAQQISHMRRKAIFDKQEAELMAMSTLPEDVYQTA